MPPHENAEVFFWRAADARGGAIFALYIPLHNYSYKKVLKNT
jgi:hypothetical protein